MVDAAAGGGGACAACWLLLRRFLFGPALPLAFGDAIADGGRGPGDGGGPRDTSK